MFGGFGNLAGMLKGAGGMMGNGGIVGGMQRMMGPKPGAAPQVPSDGAMGPTIGPGMPTAPDPAASPVKFGLPQGGILGLLQGQSPQGLMGLLQRGIGGSPLAGKMPAAGMLPPGVGMPGNPMHGPVAPAPQLPMNIDPMNQF